MPNDPNLPSIPFHDRATAFCPSRRAAIRFGLTACIAPLLTGSSWASPPLDDAALLERLIRAPGGRIPKRATDYRLSRGVIVPGGSRVSIEAGTRFVYVGPRGSLSELFGVFDVRGNDVHIVAEGSGDVVVTCDPAAPFVYAVAARVVTGLTVRGLYARNCQHVLVDGGSGDYRAIRTSGAGANISRDVAITGGGARYDQPTREGHGACLIRYTFDWHVSGCTYENIAHGVQWWGGNADPIPGWGEGAAVSERKCGRFSISGVTVRHAGEAGIWGAMGRDGVIDGCVVDGCGDVGFDAEGSNAITFSNCRARDAANGCYSTFFLCNGISFVRCTGVVTKARYPLFRLYNVTQANADNRRIEIVGGRFECLDAGAVGSIDAHAGPAHEVDIRGTTLINVAIDFFTNNMHVTRVVDCDLTFSRLTPRLVAIRVGGSRSSAGAGGAIRGSTLVRGNRIALTVASPDATAIEIVEDDYNAAATGAVRDNIISGPFATLVHLRNATRNSGMTPSFTVAGNRFAAAGREAAILKVDTDGPVAPRPLVSWDATQRIDGRSIPLSRALR